MKYLVQRKQPKFALRVLGKLPRSLRRRLLHRVALGSGPNLHRPKTYADVASGQLLQEPDLLTIIAGDKDASKSYAAGLVPELNIPRTRWLGTDPATLPDSALRGRWAAKLNAGSGAAVAGDGIEDRRELEDFINSWSKDEAAKIFGITYYDYARGGIILEDFLELSDRRPLELRFFCFGGRVELVHVYQFDERGTRLNGYVDRDGERLDVSRRVTRKLLSITADVSRTPLQFERAREVAEKLADSFAHVRVDLYVVDDDLWFGELTPYPNGGLVTFEPPEFDAHLATLWRRFLR